MSFIIKETQKECQKTPTNLSSIISSNYLLIIKQLTYER